MDGAARASSPRPSCSRSRRSSKDATRRRSRRSARSGPAHRSSRSAASTTEADPAARADHGARRADRPGPDAAPPGRPVRGLSGRRLPAAQHGPHVRRARARRLRGAVRRPTGVVTRAGDRDRARAPRAPAAQRRAARRVRRAHRRGLRSSPWRHAIRERFSGADGRGQRRRRRAAPTTRVRQRRGGGRPMRSQIEGSQAVARAVALCRPEVIAGLPDLAADAHRRGALGPGPDRGARAVRVPAWSSRSSRRMSACIGASAAGARTYTATASQGLLFMAEALFNASGLGLPIVMTVANRAIGAPINIWNDHSDAMSHARLRLDPALRRVEPGGRRPAPPGVPLAEELSAAGDGVHGRLRAHPRLRAGRPARAGRRSTRSCPPSSRGRCSTPDDPMTIGAMVGPEAFTEVKYLMHAKQMQALDEIPRIAARVRATRSAGAPAGCCARTGSRTPTRSSSRSARCSGRSTRWSTSCASRGRATSARSGSPASGRGRSTRCGRRSGERAGWSCVEKAFAVGDRGNRRPERPRSRSQACRVPVYDVVAGLGGRPITKRSLRTLLDDVLARAARPAPAALPRPRPRARRARAAPLPARAALRAARREHAARRRDRRVRGRD